MTRSAARNRATLDQVAAAAGVSKATASKVLNDRPNVSEQTRRRVKDAMRDLGYIPSTGPRQASGSRKVAVVFRTLSDMYAMRVLEGVVLSAHEHDVEVVIDVLDVPSGRTPPLSPGWIRHQAAAARAGVVVVTTELSDEQRATFRSVRMPVVHIDPVNPLDQSIVSIGSTNFAGGMQATAHLVDLGHRRIAYAGGPARSLPVRERYQGYVSTLSGAGLPVEAELVTMVEHRFDAGLAMGQQLLALKRPPTAIFAGSDSIALGVLEAARRAGLRVPEDLSVVGFDDTYGATASAPALTTVHQPIGDIGRVAVRTVLEIAKGAIPDSHHVQLSTHLVVRASTAPPRTTGPRTP